MVWFANFGWLVAAGLLFSGLAGGALFLGSVAATFSSVVAGSGSWIIRIISFCVINVFLLEMLTHTFPAFFTFLCVAT